MASFKDWKPVFQINMYDIIKLIMQNKEVQQTIIEYNQEQLQKGIDNEGKKIRTIAAEEQDRGKVYSLYTIKMKAEKGQDFGNVTLYDTGEFYKTFNIKVNDSSVEVLADFNSPGENILDNFDEKYHFLGLTNENKKGFATWILQDYLELELKKHFSTFKTN